MKEAVVALVWILPLTVLLHMAGVDFHELFTDAMTYATHLLRLFFG
ncbi:hypothetical protein [Burkholderia guangdongensis]|nr:hypothetical protein [Burkholderia guangdongensis]